MFIDYEKEKKSFDTLKKEDHYHFSIPFEYIKKNYGNGEYDIAEALMEVDVDWDDFDHGYRVSFNCPDMYLIDPDEGNGDEEEIYSSAVENTVLRHLRSMGIPNKAMVGGLGR